MGVLAGTRDITQLSPALPVNNSILQQHGVKLRKSQFSICAAAPSVGKSMFARNIAVRTRAESLYFSADSDEWTTRQSVLGVLTGMPLEKIDDQLNNGSRNAIEYFGRVLDNNVGHIDWAFNADLDIDYIVRRLRAHEAVWDRFPDFVFVDNLLDMVGEDETELRAACKELRKIARSTEAHVMALHHVIGAKEDGDRIINLSDLQQKVGKVPEVVLGLHMQSETQLLLHVAKNRGGKRGVQVPLPINYETGWIGGWNYSKAA
jgi:replicative DNA helicase